MCVDQHSGFLLTVPLQVRVKILLMSSQSHVFVFEPETSVARMVCGPSRGRCTRANRGTSCITERDRLESMARGYVAAGICLVGAAHRLPLLEWNTDPVRPPSPAYFRFLYMGKMLSDDQTLAGTL